MVRSSAVDRRRLVWTTVFATALMAVIGLVWTLAVPSGSTEAAPPGGPAAEAGDRSTAGTTPAGPSLTSRSDDPDDGGSTTTYDSYTTLTRSPDDEGDAVPVPLAATSSLPRATTSTAGPAAAPTTVPSCIDPLTDNTARCVTTTTDGGPGATGGVCDTSVGRTTDPGCTGATAVPTTASTMLDPCAAMTTFGCPGSTTTGPTVPPPTPPPSTTATAPPMTCFPACPATTRLTP